MTGQSNPQPTTSIRRNALSKPLSKILTGLFSFVSVCVVATAGYCAAGWSISDAAYMVIITIFGVGYGEVQPIESASLRALTVAVIIAGYGTVIYTVGGFAQLLVDGELNRALGFQRMTNDINRLREHTIVCGIGRLGSILAKELHEAGKPFVAIDTDADRLKEAEERGYLVLHGDATDEETLEAAGVARATTVAAVLSQDAINVFVTITARQMNPDITILARAENPRSESKLRGSGADQVVLPTAIGGKQLAQLIVRPTAEKMLEQIQQDSNTVNDLNRIGLQFNELPVSAESAIVNQKISEIEIRGNHGFLIVGIRRADGTNSMNPDPESVLAAGDVVVVLGHQNEMPDILRRFSQDKKRISYRGASIDR